MLGNRLALAGITYLAVCTIAVQGCVMAHGVLSPPPTWRPSSTNGLVFGRVEIVRPDGTPDPRTSQVVLGLVRVIPLPPGKAAARPVAGGGLPTSTGAVAIPTLETSETSAGAQTARLFHVDSEDQGIYNFKIGQDGFFSNALPPGHYFVRYVGIGLMMIGPSANVPGPRADCSQVMVDTAVNIVLEARANEALYIGTLKVQFESNVPTNCLIVNTGRTEVRRVSRVRGWQVVNERDLAGPIFATRYPGIQAFGSELLQLLPPQ